MQIFGNRFGNKQDSDDDEIRIERPEAKSIVPRGSGGKPGVGFDTVLGPGSRLEGDLVSKGNIRLDGFFTGMLDITGNVLVGETADITADIEATNISIAGLVRGNVIGEKVQLLRTAQVTGDITAVSFSTEEGAFIDGKISMKSADSTTPAEAVASEPSPAPLEDELQPDNPTPDEAENPPEDAVNPEADDTFDAPTVIMGHSPDAVSADDVTEDATDKRE